MFVSMHTNHINFREFLGGALYGDVIEYMRTGRDAAALRRQADTRRLWLGKFAEHGRSEGDGYRVVRRQAAPYAPKHTIGGKAVDSKRLKEQRPDVYQLCREPSTRGYSRIVVPRYLLGAVELPFPVLEPPAAAMPDAVERWGVRFTEVLGEYRTLREDVTLLERERAAARERIEAVVARELPEWDGLTPMKFADGFTFVTRQWWYSAEKAVAVLPGLLGGELDGFLVPVKPTAPKAYWAVSRAVVPGERRGEHGALVGVEDDLEPWEGE